MNPVDPIVEYLTGQLRRHGYNTAIFATERDRVCFDIISPLTATLKENTTVASIIVTTKGIRVTKYTHKHPVVTHGVNPFGQKSELIELSNPNAFQMAIQHVLNHAPLVFSYNQLTIAK